VTLFALAESSFDPGSLYCDLPDTAEVMHDRTISDLSNFLEERAGYYDAFWIARTHNFDAIADILGDSVAVANTPRIILDTEAIAAVRDAQRAALSGVEQHFDVDAALAHEFIQAQRCDTIVAVSSDEAQRLRALTAM